MIGYGTKIVAGVNPKRAGEHASGLPVYRLLADAATRGRRSMSPSCSFRRRWPSDDAVIDAIEAGIQTLVVLDRAHSGSGRHGNSRRGCAAQVRASSVRTLRAGDAG